MTDQPGLGALFGAADTTTFLGLPACTDLDKLAAPIALLGAPCATPYASVGAYCRNAPRALRRAVASLAANLHHHDFDNDGPVFPDERLTAADCGDLAFDESDAAGNRDLIRKSVARIIARGAVPILLGGDDSIPIPMLEAFAGEQKYTILQIDAHIDWRDSHMGETMGLSSTMRRASEMAHIERIVQVGARGIGSARPQDYRDALAWGVKFIPGRELHRSGVGAVLDLIPEGSQVIICIDADALDPVIIPGVIGRSPGGLSYYQCADIIQGVARKARIRAMDFVEYMPERDVDGLGALTFGRLIITAMGAIAGQMAK